MYIIREVIKCEQPQELNTEEANSSKCKKLYEFMILKNSSLEKENLTLHETRKFRVPEVSLIKKIEKLLEENNYNYEADVVHQVEVYALDNKRVI